MSNGAELAIQAKGIVRRFPLPSDKLFGPRKYVHAVDGIDVEVPVGKTLGIVGESGCGKSTLGRVLIGLDRADQGVIEWAGKPAGKHDGTVQAVFQDPGSALNPRQTIFNAIAEAVPRTPGIDGSSVFRVRIGVFSRRGEVGK
ncbi:MAG TPA: ATP-binding cassette domain-containing protein [Beutenbergiaceae bacterium]|nr:ATP-binding cassette domain-containing protein [Beutenbergiaceae bacterium]